MLMLRICIYPTPSISRNAHAQKPLPVATCIALLAMLHPRRSTSMYSLTTLLLRREDLTAQVKHRQRARDLDSFADFENRKVPVRDM